MKKGIVNIHLSEGPVFNGCYGKENSNCGELGNWTEGLLEVKSFFLGVTFGHKSGFVPFKRAI